MAEVSVYRDPLTGGAYIHSQLDDDVDIPYPQKLGWVGTMHRVLGLLFGSLVKSARTALEEGRMTPTEMSALGAAVVGTQEDMEQAEQMEVVTSAEDAVTAREMGRALALVMDMPTTEES